MQISEFWDKDRVFWGRSERLDDFPIVMLMAMMADTVKTTQS